MIPIDRDLTIWEWHAAVLGGVGAVPGALLAGGEFGAAATISAPLLAVAFGVKRYFGSDSKAEMTIRREPWYFLFVFVVSAVAAALAVSTGML